MTNRDRLDAALADGKITAEQHAAGIIAADQADAENAEREALAVEQAAKRDANILHAVPAKASGHPNDGAVALLTGSQILDRLTDDDSDRMFAFAPLDSIGMVRGSSGETVSGYCRVLVGGKAIGALTIYAPKADESADSTMKEPAEIKQLDKLCAGKLAEMDRLFPLRDRSTRIPLEGEALMAQMVKRAPLQLQADEYAEQAEAARQSFAARVKAAKGSWEGRTALDVFDWRYTAGATAGAHAPKA